MVQDIQVIIDPEVAGIDFDVRRPYFRMRGRPVTEEQAFDIIRRTDSFFQFDMDEYHIKDLVESWFLLENVWYSPSLYPHPRGWVRPDGVIGTNGFTGKYPNEEDFLCSVLPLKQAFPYLDLAIAVTDWNEMPPYAWNAHFGSGGKAGDDDALDREDYPDFLDHIVYGIWLHDSAVELMAPGRAREKYEAYHRLYAGPNEDIYKMSYCNNHLQPAGLAYLKRCIRSHGLDPEEVLSRYVWGPDGLQWLR